MPTELERDLVYDVLFGTVPDRLVEQLDCTVLLVHSGRPRRHTFLRAILDRFVFKARDRRPSA